MLSEYKNRKRYISSGLILRLTELHNQVVREKFGEYAIEFVEGFVGVDSFAAGSVDEGAAGYLGSFTVGECREGL